MPLLCLFKSFSQASKCFCFMLEHVGVVMELHMVPCASRSSLPIICPLYIVAVLKQMSVLCHSCKVQQACLNTPLAQTFMGTVHVVTVFNCVQWPPEGV